MAFWVTTLPCGYLGRCVADGLVAIGVDGGGQLVGGIEVVAIVDGGGEFAGLCDELGGVLLLQLRP
ncbi:MAG: hypothetical protein HQ523_11060 [Lentisphaerae bacterium]|nr:hypothetical protein [Lentisphaerota bacterium]